MLERDPVEARLLPLGQKPARRRVEAAGSRGRLPVTSAPTHSGLVRLARSKSVYARPRSRSGSTAALPADGFAEHAVGRSDQRPRRRERSRLRSPPAETSSGVTDRALDRARRRGATRAALAAAAGGDDVGLPRSVGALPLDARDLASSRAAVRGVAGRRRASRSVAMARAVGLSGGRLGDPARVEGRAGLDDPRADPSNSAGSTPRTPRRLRIGVAAAGGPPDLQI